MYLVGADHPLKARVIALVPQLLSAREAFVTSAEVFQEIVHRYRAQRDRTHLDAAYEALEALVGQVFDVSKTDVDDARTISAKYEALSARDCLHFAVMRRAGTHRIWSYDDRFDRIPSIVRIQ